MARLTFHTIYRSLMQGLFPRLLNVPGLRLQTSAVPALMLSNVHAFGHSIGYLARYVGLHTMTKKRVVWLASAAVSNDQVCGVGDRFRGFCDCAWQTSHEQFSGQISGLGGFQAKVRYYGFMISIQRRPVIRHFGLDLC